MFVLVQFLFWKPFGYFLGKKLSFRLSACSILACVILFLYFSALFALQLPRLGRREVILVLFVRLFGLRLFGFCLFSLLLRVWDGLLLVIVALPGLVSYLY